MKYLIITKGPSMLKGLGLEKLEKIKENLEKSFTSGKVEGCYGLVSGGSVWILNSDSHAELARGLREYNLAGENNVEVIPIVDGIGVINAYIEHYKEEMSKT